MKILPDEGFKDVIIDENTGDVYNENGEYLSDNTIKPPLSIDEFLDKAWCPENYPNQYLKDREKPQLSADDLTAAEKVDATSDNLQNSDIENKIVAEDLNEVL